MNKPFEKLPLDHDRILSMTESELYGLVIHITLFNCGSMARAIKVWNEKLETKYQACFINQLSKSAQKCFGNLNISDVEDTSDETMTKVEKCLEDNKQVVNKVDSIIIKSLKESKHFKKYINHVMDDKKRDEFGNVENPNFQKWQQEKFCFPELGTLVDCMKQKSNQYQVSETEFEQAIHSGKTFECFMGWYNFYNCFVTSFCGNQLYSCLKNTNQKDADFMQCFQKDFGNCMNRLNSKIHDKTKQ